MTTIRFNHHPRPQPDTTWIDRAACRESDPELFWPSTGEDPRAAIAICEECPVRQECLDYALTLGEMDGIWGGTSGRQRRRIRSTQRRSA